MKIGVGSEILLICVDTWKVRLHCSREAKVIAYIYMDGEVGLAFMWPQADSSTGRQTDGAHTAHTCSTYMSPWSLACLHVATSFLHIGCFLGTQLVFACVCVARVFTTAFLSACPPGTSPHTPSLTNCR